MFALFFFSPQNVLPLLDRYVHNHGRERYLIMPYMPGGSLHDAVVGGGPFAGLPSGPLRLRIAAGIAEGWPTSTPSGCSTGTSSRPTCSSTPT